ncbi:MAG: LysR family transcriptional regulator [Pseudomonadota bacterium]
MDLWDEMRTAYQVAKLGTITAAAEALGVHRATVIRQVDRLEAELGAKLFLRHSGGYTPTEVGQDLLQVAATTDEQFNELAGRLRGQAQVLKGELVVTSAEFFVPIVTHALRPLLRNNPNLKIRYRATRELLKLEFGDAHLAIRTGSKPNKPDFVVQPFLKISSGLYAHADYVDQYGKPRSPADFSDHYFVCGEPDGLRPQFLDWLPQTVPKERIALASNSVNVQFSAIESGLGIGFFPTIYAAQKTNLVEVMPPREEWEVDAWLVTHVDLHRSDKVQTCLSSLKRALVDYGADKMDKHSIPVLSPAST